MLSKNGKNTKELKRVDLTIVKLLLLVIHENASIKKTPLMEKTNINYLRLNSYLNWLELIGFIQIDNLDMILTKDGLSFLSRL